MFLARYGMHPKIRTPCILQFSKKIDFAYDRNNKVVDSLHILIRKDKSRSYIAMVEFVSNIRLFPSVFRTFWSQEDIPNILESI